MQLLLPQSRLYTMSCKRNAGPRLSMKTGAIQSKRSQEQTADSVTSAGRPPNPEKELVENAQQASDRQDSNAQQVAFEYVPVLTCLYILRFLCPRLGKTFIKFVSRQETSLAWWRENERVIAYNDESRSVEFFSSESLDTCMSARYNCSLHLLLLSSLTGLSLSLQLFAVSQFSFLIGHIPFRLEQNFDLRLMLSRMRRLTLFRVREISSFTPESNCFIVICVSGSSILKMLLHASSTKCSHHILYMKACLQAWRGTNMACSVGVKGTLSMVVTHHTQ